MSSVSGQRDIVEITENIYSTNTQKGQQYLCPQFQTKTQYNSKHKKHIKLSTHTI